MELGFGLVLGYLALPWMWMGLLTLLFIVDVVLTENDCFGSATCVLIVGTGLVAWLGGDVNVLSWVWANLAEIAKFLFFYFAAGALWSIVKWYLYLLKVRDKVKGGTWRYRHGERGAEGSSSQSRPYESYATNNRARLMGWIAHWPFSMVGSLFGDVLTRVVTQIYQVLSGLYDRVAEQVFSGFDSGNDEDTTRSGHRPTF